MTKEEIERLKAEQPDHKQAFEMKEGGRGRGRKPRAPMAGITISSDLQERLRKNKKLGKPWKINRSKICREALEQKLDEADAAFKKHREFKACINAVALQRRGLVGSNKTTIESLKRIVLELEELERKGGEE